MPWCPKCKNEYYEGVSVCADCGCELVDELMEKEPESEPAEESLSYEELEEREELLEEIKERNEEISKGPYRSSRERANDNRSSGYTLVVVGAIGMALLIMNILGIIPLPFSSSTRYISLSLMGVLFAVFLVMGVVSFRNAKKYDSRADSEENLKKEIVNWCKTGILPETLEISEDGISEEQIFFLRYEEIKKQISEHFLNLDKGFLDNVTDECYKILFEE